MIYHTGTVFWPPPTQLRSTCKIDVTFFPFDTQRCYLKFGSWTYHGLEVDLRNRSDNIDLTNYVINGEFDLVKVIQKRRIVKYSCCTEPYPDVIYVIYIRRKLLYYMLNVVLPCSLMSALTLLVFRLPPNSGEKIALGITVLLAFSVFTLNVSEKMPETSESYPLIGIYLTCVITISAISVVLTVTMMNLYYRGPFNKAVPGWLRCFALRFLRRLLCLPPPREMRETGEWEDLDQMKSILIVNTEADGSNPSTTQAPDTYRPLKQTNTNHQSTTTQLQQTLLGLMNGMKERHRIDDALEKINYEWRMIAEVLDRLLFWIFLVLTVALTLVLLFIIPLYRRQQELEDPNVLFDSIS